MGQGNVRALNKKTAPLNTIQASRPPATGLLTVPRANGEPAPKRPRRSSPTDAPYTRSGYFDNSPERLRSAHNSPEDATETASVSSHAKPASAVIGIPEFRKSQETVNRKSETRIRRSRQRGASKTSPVTVDADATSPTTLQAVTSPISPDVLVSPGHPPARVTSDIVPPPLQKRKQQQAHEGPRIKRPKLGFQPESINDSDEDELSAPVRRREIHPSRIVNLGQLSPQPGAVHTTDFAIKRKKKGPLIVNHPLYIAKAGSGNFYFDAATHTGKIALAFEEARSTFSVVEIRGESIQRCDSLQTWLSVPSEKLHKLVHSATRSKFVRVLRAVSGDASGTLSIEFSDVPVAASFVSQFPSAKHHLFTNVERLEDSVQRELQACATGQAARNRDKVLGERSATAPQENDLKQNAERQATRSMPLRQTRKMTEMMANDAFEELKATSLSETEVDVEISPRQPASRKTRNSTETALELPSRWTDENPRWAEKWSKSLTYPATGRNRATVDKEDIERLDEGEFLNDNLVNFYLRFLQQDLEQNRPETLRKVHVLSTFFFDRLRSARGTINYEGVKSWTAKLDIFSYDYIVVPVNESLHWYLVIICNAPNALNGIPEDVDNEERPGSDGGLSTRISSVERGVSRVSLDDTSHPADQAPIELPDEVDSSPKQRRTPKRSKEQGNDPRYPRIVVLDSLSLPHRRTWQCLKEYLAEEAATRKDQDLKLLPSGMTAKGIPQQDNYCDCGIYILGYMEEFLKDPDAAARKLLTKQDLSWDVQAPKLRTKIRNLLFELQKEQQDRLTAELAERRRQKLEAKKKKSLSTAPKASPSSSRQPLPDDARDRSTMPPNSVSPPSDQHDQLEPEELDLGKSREPHPESPKLINHLSESSSESAFKTAPSTPTPLSQSYQPTSGRLRNLGDTAEAERALEAVPEPRLIKQLSDSASDKDGAVMTIEDDDELCEVTPQVMGKTQNQAKKPDETFTKQRFLPPSASPEASTSRKQHGARYHGVEQKLDLTGN